MNPKTEIRLTRSGWHHGNGVSCRGWAWDSSGVLRTEATLAEAFAGVDSSSGFIQALQGLNGSYCVVAQLGNTLFAAVDHVRSIPLFFANLPGGLILSDDARTVSNVLQEKGTDGIRLEEFLLTGYVTGNDTLVEGLSQLLAGEMLEYRECAPTPVLHSYYTYQHQQAQQPSQEALMQRLDDLHARIIHSLAQNTSGRQIVVPLSGGLDSRLIARCLAAHKVPDVLCFSYGNPKSREARISQAVAEAHGLAWVFIPHTRQMWHQAYNSAARKEYYHLADNLSASAHIQDWLAVRELKDRRLISDDAVFVPGHSADFLEGSHLPELFLSKDTFSPQEVAEAIIARHYRLWDVSTVEPALRKEIAARITAAIGEGTMDAEAAAGAFETFDWRERQAKFIVNSVRVYEFYGYEWRLPLWDMALLDFWSKMPLSYRMGRSFYLGYAQRAGDLGIPRYTHETFFTRVRERIIRDSRGRSYDVRYARFLSDPSIKGDANLKVANLCPSRVQLPSFVDTNLPILKADINALQTLVMLREWQG